MQSAFIRPVDAEGGLIAEQLGFYNELPPNFEKIGQGEFLWRFSVSAAERVYQFRQVIWPTSSPYGMREHYCSMHLWVLPDWSGFGWITEHNSGVPHPENYTATYFKFAACNHDYETLVNRMCYWEGRCKICGYWNAIDSGD